MDQQNQGPGSSNPSIVPAKRKRGQPRKEGSTFQADISPVRCVPNIVISPNQTAGATGSSADDEMLGKVVTGVIEGCFSCGYLLNVRIEDSPTYLQGVVFKPGLYVPVTPENDVAPHLEMIQRKHFPIPVLNPQAQMQSSIPSSGQRRQQPAELQPLMPFIKDQGLATGIHSGALVLHENQPASVPVSMTNIPTSDLSILAGGIPQTISDPGHESRSASIMKMECDKIVELDTSRLVKEPGADGATEKDLKSTAENTNLLSVPENIDKELQTRSSVQLNEPIQDLPKISNFELKKTPAPAGPESIRSEQIQDEPKNSNIEVSQMLVSAVLEPAQSEQIQDLQKNSNIEVNELPVSAEPEAMQSEQIHEPRNSNMELNDMSVSADPEAMQSKQIHVPRNSNVEPNDMPVSADPEAMQPQQIHEPRNSNMELNDMPVSTDPEAMQPEQIHEPRNSNMELNDIPVSAHPEAMQSEQIHESRNSNMELNDILVSADPEAMLPEQIHEPRKSNMELNEMHVSAEPERMQSEQIHEPWNSNKELNEMHVSADPGNVQSVEKLGD